MCRVAAVLFFATRCGTVTFDERTRRPGDREYLIPASLLQRHQRAAVHHDVEKHTARSSMSRFESQGMVSLAEATNTMKMSVATQLMPFGNPFSILKDVCKCILSCALIAWIIKSVRGCCSCDVRRWTPIRKFLLWTGYDEFEEFRMHVKVHTMKDVETRSGLMSRGLWRVKVSFRRAEFQTALVEGRKWEQSKIIDVRQGATHCAVQICQAKSVGGDTIIAERILDTKKDILDKPGFLGTKQLIHLQQKNRDIGSVYITFRLASDDEKGNLVIFDGLDEDSALALKLREIMDEEGFPPDLPALDGIQKQKLLAQVLRGSLKDDSKAANKIYVEVKYNIKANLLPENERAKLMQKLASKERKSGKGGGKGGPPPSLAPMWYWCQWKSKDAYERGLLPKSFFPFAAIASVHANPKEIDEFTLRVKPEKENKDSERMKFNVLGQERSVWVDAIEHLLLDLKESKKDAGREMRRKEEIEKGMYAGWTAHNAYVAQYGAWPNNDAEWANWTKSLADKGIDYKVIAAMREQMETALQWESLQNAEWGGASSSAQDTSWHEGRWAGQWTESGENDWAGGEWHY